MTCALARVDRASLRLPCPRPGPLPGPTLTKFDVRIRSPGRTDMGAACGGRPSHVLHVSSECWCSGMIIGAGTCQHGLRPKCPRIH